MAFCNQCGAPMDDGRFCPMCGAENPPTDIEQPIAVAPTEDPAEEPAVAPAIPSITEIVSSPEESTVSSIAEVSAPPAPRKKSNKGLWIALACVSTVLVLVLVFVVFGPLFGVNWFGFNLFDNGKGEGQDATCGLCNGSAYCHAITHNDVKDWFCDDCYDTVKNTIRAQYDRNNTSGEGVWENCDRCGIYTQCTLHEHEGVYEWVCRFCK